MRLDDGQIEVLDQAMAEVLRQKTPAQRLQIGFALWDSTKGMLTAHLSAEHPDWTQECIGQEVARRLSHGDSDLFMEHSRDAFVVSHSPSSAEIDNMSMYNGESVRPEALEG